VEGDTDSVRERVGLRMRSFQAFTLVEKRVSYQCSLSLYVMISFVPLSKRT